MPAAAQGDQKNFTRISEKTLQKVLNDFSASNGKLTWVRKVEPNAVNKKPAVYHYITFTGLSERQRRPVAAVVWVVENSIRVRSLGFKTLSGGEISLERVNEWNQRMGAHGAAFIAKDGSAVVASAHDMRAGTNEAIIGNWLITFAVLLMSFEESTR